MPNYELIGRRVCFISGIGCLICAVVEMTRGRVNWFLFDMGIAAYNLHNGLKS